MAKNVLTHNLSEPLNGTTEAKLDINAGTGNLTIDRLTGGEQLLASGSLQYLEDQGVPTRILDSRAGQTTLTLKGRGVRESWFRLPWSACGGGKYQWQIHLNPRVRSDINAHSGGGNIRLNLAGMSVTHVSADTGGGNMELVLPENAADLSATASTGGGNVTVEVGRGIHGTNSLSARSGAGNVMVHVPRGVAVKVHATTGLGKVIVDPQFSKIDDKTYQSPDYDRAADKLEITAQSGAGNVSVSSK